MLSESEQHQFDVFPIYSHNRKGYKSLTLPLELRKELDEEYKNNIDNKYVEYDKNNVNLYVETNLSHLMDISGSLIKKIEKYLLCSFR